MQRIAQQKNRIIVRIQEAVEKAKWRIIESVEIKHGVAITHEMISQLKEKIASSGLKTFYVLSTREDIPIFQARKYPKSQNYQ